MLAVFVVAEKRIGGDDATALAVALKRSTSVTSVHLQCQAPFCASWFRRAFIGARRVRWSVAGNRIGDAGAVALADALKSNKSVAEIYLRRNARQKALLPGASSVSGSGNDVGVVGVEAWANALLSNTALTCVDLSCEQIGFLLARRCRRSIEADFGALLSFSQ